MKENKIPSVKMPDRFVLEKSDINMILGSVEKFWNRTEMNAIQNAGYSTTMAMVKASVHIQPLITLKNIYFSINEATRQIETLNQLKISLLEAVEQNLDPKIIKSFEQLVDIQYEKLKNGDAFES